MGMFDDPNWPGLTFNPAKGDLHTIESLAYDVKTVGDELDEMREMLLSIGKTDGVWDGEAAKKFQDKVGELPKYLKQGHESMNACSRALRSWHDELQTMQQRAKSLEEQALDARKRLDQKNEAVDRVNVKIEGAMFRQLSEQEAKSLSEEADSASAAAKEAAADLQSLIKKGEELRKNWEEQAEKAEKAIREASKNRPPDISVWDKITDGLKGAWDGFKNFLIDNADLFSTISAALATAAIVVNVIPIGGQVASAILGAGSMVFAGAAAAGHYMGGAPLWKVGLDVAGVLPGVGVVKGLTAGVRGAKGMVGAGRGLMDGIKNGLITQGINKGIAGTVGRFLPAAKNIDPWKISLPMKAGSAIFGAGKMIFGGDEGGSSTPPVTTQPAPADRPSVVDKPPVQTMPYPATGDKFHATLAA